MCKEIEANTRATQYCDTFTVEYSHSFITYLKIGANIKYSISCFIQHRFQLSLNKTIAHNQGFLISFFDECLWNSCFIFCTLQNEDGTAMRFFLFCGGKAKQIDFFQEADMLQLFRQSLIDFAKTPASCSAICQELCKSIL
jgi:hypothetical protein